METGGDIKSNANTGTGPATNIWEHEVNQTSPLMKHGHGSTNNNHFEAHSSSWGNNTAPLSSSSQNPFLVPCDATDNTGNGGMDNGSSSTYPAGSPGETHHSSIDDVLGLNSSPAPYESSRGNPFHEPTDTNAVHFDAFESWQNQPSANETDPTNVESHNHFQVTEQGQQGMANSNLGTSFSPASESSSQETGTNASPKLGLDSHITAESSDDEIPISSMPNHGHSGNVTGQNSPAVAPGSNLEVDTNKGSEIQNPPAQMMERPGESGNTSQYVFPSHVFARNNTNAPVEWSTASNESLFSIYMGNTSFSSELVCFKSCELDKPGDNMCMLDPPNASPSHQPPAPAPASVNKFSDINPRTCELHEDSAKVNEAKAAEMMREVIMESSQTTENVGKGDDKNSNSHRQSDGTAKSYAFHTSTDRDKNVSSKHGGEKQEQQKQTEEKETPNAVDQAPKSTTNASSNKWLSCFPCCG